MLKIEIATTAERNQIMGHSRVNIYEQHYQNRVINIDITAAILKTPSRSSLLESVGHLGLDRDPRVPQTLDQKDRDAVLADPKLVQLIAEIKGYRASFPRFAFRESKNHEKRTPEQKHLRKIQARRALLRKNLLKQAIAEKQHQFFANVDNRDIRQSRLGMSITHNPSTPVYSLLPRANLAEIFRQEDTENTRPSESNRRREALQNLIKLCQMREPHHRNPASSLKRKTNIPVQEGDSGLKGDPMKDDFRDIKEAFENMELIPLRLPSTICLFCLGDSELSSAARTASFSRIDSLRRHIDDLHLSHYDHDALIVYPHPTYNTSLQGVNYFKNHAATVHNVFLSK